jgi:hypothetical protein
MNKTSLRSLRASFAGNSLREARNKRDRSSGRESVVCYQERGSWLKLGGSISCHLMAMPLASLLES